MVFWYNKSEKNFLEFEFYRKEISTKNFVLNSDLVTKAHRDNRYKFKLRILDENVSF